MAIRINKNESPHRALTPEEISKIAVDTQYNRYAVDEYQRLVNAYADFRGISPDTISLANGSDEWLQKFMILFGRKGPVLAFESDFGMYETYASQLNCKFIKIPVEANFTFNYEAIYEVIKREKPALFLFSQPNNPFGYLHPTEFVERTSELMAMAGGYLVIDEAYAEFADPLPEYPENDHIIYLRTLSKAYGLAGLRIGVVRATPATIKLLNSIEHPYPVNNMSLNLASYLLEQPERTRDFIELNKKLAKKLVAIFEDEVKGIVNYLPTVTNYIFTYGPAAVSLGEWVEARGFIIRRYQDKNEPVVLQQGVRYSIGSEEELTKLRRVIADWRDNKWQFIKSE